jgi:hypothetical protein
MDRPLFGIKFLLKSFRSFLYIPCLDGDGELLMNGAVLIRLFAQGEPRLDIYICTKDSDTSFCSYV